MSTSDALETLRGLVAQPSKAHWKAICQTLADLPDDSEALALSLDYVEAHTARWRTSRGAVTQSAPASWVYQLLAGKDQPRLRIVRHLDLGSASRTVYTPQRFALDGAAHLPDLVRLDRASLAHLASSPWLANVETLILRENQLHDRDIDVFIGSTALPNLQTLDLYYNEITEGALFLSDFVTPLTTLHLGLNGRSGSALADALATTTKLTNLRELDIDWIYYGSWEDLEVVATNPHLHADVRGVIEEKAVERQHYDENYE